MISSGIGTRGEDRLYHVIVGDDAVVGPRGGTCATSAIIGVCVHM